MRTREKLAQNRQEKATIEQHLSETERDLSATERKLATTNQKLTSTSQKLLAEEEQGRRLERKLERAGERLLELQGEIAALDARLDAEASKTDELQEAVAKAVAARSRAELELEFAQEELEALKRRDATPHAPEPDSALDDLERDRAFVEALSPAFVDAFVTVKRAEWARFEAHTTDWEAQRVPASSSRSPVVNMELRFDRRLARRSRAHLGPAAHDDDRRAALISRTSSAIRTPSSKPSETRSRCHGSRGWRCMARHPLGRRRVHGRDTRSSSAAATEPSFLRRALGQSTCLHSGCARKPPA